MNITCGKQSYTMAPVGENVDGVVTSEGILLLAVDTRKTLRSSQSGKSDTVATTGGNVAMAGLKIGVNAYRPLDKTDALKRQHAKDIAAEQARQNAV